MLNGYLQAREKKLLVSVLVDPTEGKVLQAVRVPFQKRFVDFRDRLLDKQTFS